MKAALLAALLLTGTAGADVYVGEIATGICKLERGKDFKKAVRDSYGDKSVEVSHEKEGRCGESAYLIRTKPRRRWAIFPTKTGCECYLKMAQMLEPTK